MEIKCYRCEATEDERSLTKCVICFRHYCADCAHDFNGRAFCSKHCAHFFFFGDEDG